MYDFFVGKSTIVDLPIDNDVPKKHKQWEILITKKLFCIGPHNLQHIDFRLLQFESYYTKNLDGHFEII